MAKSNSTESTDIQLKMISNEKARGNGVKVKVSEVTKGRIHEKKTERIPSSSEGHPDNVIIFS